LAFLNEKHEAELVEFALKWGPLASEARSANALTQVGQLNETLNPSSLGRNGINVKVYTPASMKKLVLD
jgi:hypothetical protein